MSWSPLHIAMQWNVERNSDLALNLKFVKVFDTLSWRLDLSKYDKVLTADSVHMHIYLDSEGVDGRNNIKWSSQHTVTW